jgi:hypothetical protein
MRVIELLRAPVRPFNELEIATDVIRVTARAVGAVRARVQPSVLIDEPRDLAVAGEAFRRHTFLPAAVALDAIESAVERGVRRGERPGRDLSFGTNGRDNTQCHNAE